MNRFRRLGRSSAIAGVALLLVVAATFAHGLVSQPSSSSPANVGVQNDGAGSPIDIDETLEVEDSADVDTDSEAADDLTADLREACGSGVTVPDLSGLTEDQAETLVELLIEACEEAEDAREAADDLTADLREACGSGVTVPDLSGLTEDQAETLVEPLIEACEEAEDARDDDGDDVDSDSDEVEDDADDE